MQTQNKRLILNSFIARYELKSAIQDNTHTSKKKATQYLQICLSVKSDYC